MYLLIYFVSSCIVPVIAVVYSLMSRWEKLGLVRQAKKAFDY